MRHRKARVLIALSSIAGGAGQLRGINALQGVKATGYVFAFTIAIVEKRRRREA